MGRRARGEGTVVQRKDGRWQAELPIRTRGKKKERKYFYGKTQEEAVAKRDAYRLGHHSARGGETLGGFVETYLSTIAPERMRETTLVETRRALHRFERLFPLPLSQLEREDIEKERRRMARHLAPSTMNVTLKRLKALLDEAVERKKIDESPAARISPLKEPDPPRRHMRLEEAARLLEYLGESRLGLQCTWALATGMRKGEILGMQWEHWDEQAGTYRVEKALKWTKGLGFYLEAPKTQKSRRTLFLPSQAVDVLRKQRATQAQLRLQAGPLWTDHGLVWTTPVGMPIWPKNVNRDLTLGLQRAGLPHYRWHDLRHTCASWLISKGVPIKVVQELLGHKSIQTTLDTYGHLLDEAKKEAAHHMDLVLDTVK